MEMEQLTAVFPNLTGQKEERRRNAAMKCNANQRRGKKQNENNTISKNDVTHNNTIISQHIGL